MESGAKALSILLPELSNSQKQQLDQYAALLSDWNRRVNLISRKDIGNLWENHILPSLAALRMVEIPAGALIVDIGSGGGLPAVPLKIARPDLSVLMVESIGKKAQFLAECLRTLRLRGISVSNQRAEALATDPHYCGCFDLLTARAVAALPRLIKWGRPFLKPGGRWLLWKGTTDVPELENIAGRLGLDCRVHQLPAGLVGLSPRFAEMRLFEIRLNSSPPAGR